MAGKVVNSLHDSQKRAQLADTLSLFGLAYTEVLTTLRLPLGGLAKFWTRLTTEIQVAGRG